MKTLTLLRHAKSGWDDPVPRDFDRPLNRKGQRAALAIGNYMRAEGLAFDHIAASPAVRVIETLGQVAAGYGGDLAPVLDQRIYLASAATLFDLVRTFPATADSALLVGHNPGLEELALTLTAEGALREEIEIKFPTGSIAEMRFDVERWDQLEPDSGALVRFVRPRDLDPALGPDQN